MSRRLGILGGTFDPVHEAHLQVARAARDAYFLDHVLLIPNRIPPHKTAQTLAPYQDRLAMVALAVQAEDRLIASDLEKDEARSYSVLTLERLRAQLPPSDRIFFIIGADAFAEVHTWFRWQDVLQLTEFIVVSRPGFSTSIPPGAVVHSLQTVHLTVSSSEIRQELARGIHPNRLHPDVYAYIIKHGLYRAPASDAS